MPTPGRPTPGLPTPGRPTPRAAPSDAEPPFSVPGDAARVSRRAASAAPAVQAASRRERAGWLKALAAAPAADRAALVALAHADTRRWTGRLDGELTRTINQLGFFAEVLDEGSFLEATLDRADPSSVPPRPDLRRLLRAGGPVAVFSAPDFPFAFSVLGNDTASALAAG